MPENEQDNSLYDFPLGFHFQVQFGENAGSALEQNTKDVRFQEVTGLTAEIGIESYDEGGENRFSHRLPTRAKFNNLVLKRGMLFDTELYQWFYNAIFNFQFEPKTVVVSLLNAEGTILESWEFHSVWPVKWSISDLKASENAIVIETLELAYQYYDRKFNSTKKT